MASAALDRDYATAWPLIETVLKEACREQHRTAARQWFFEHAHVVMLPGKLSRDTQQTAIRHLQEAAASLHALDAFAIASRIRRSPEQNDILSLQDALDFSGPLLRLVRWVEAWAQLRAPRGLGEQGLITLLHARDERSIATQVAKHLQQQAAVAESKNRVGDAYRLRLGAVLCKRDPTPRDVPKLGAQLAKKAPEAIAEQRPLGSAVVRAAPHARMFVVHLNHLACCASKKTYICKRYRRRAGLESFIRTRVQFLKAGEKPASPPIVPYHVGLDFVGAVVGNCAPAVCSCRREQPRNITHARAWAVDLHSFLGRDLKENPTTLEELVRRHEPGEKPKSWLFGDFKQRKGTEVPDLVKDTQQHLARGEHTAWSLIGILKTALAKARQLDKEEKYTPYRQLQGWCQSVTRHVMTAAQPWIVKAPPKPKADVHSPLRFNPDFNYALIDFCSSPPE